MKEEAAIRTSKKTREASSHLSYQSIRSSVHLHYDDFEQILHGLGRGLLFLLGPVLCRLSEGFLVVELWVGLLHFGELRLHEKVVCGWCALDLLLLLSLGGLLGGGLLCGLLCDWLLDGSLLCRGLFLCWCLRHLSLLSH